MKNALGPGFINSDKQLNEVDFVEPLQVEEKWFNYGNVVQLHLATY